MQHQQLANAIRFLSVDAVQKAQSGHPGMPLGMADIATVLWRDVLKINPKNPQWHNRDRFILSNGHGSMLLYSLLHLSGFNLSIDEIKQFRQLHSKTPGHPEQGETAGVEMTTGPLGQGIASAVGMAIAEKTLAAQFNQPQHEIIDHHTYAFCGDGCLMEGISHEACSLAGSLKLGKLIVFWDDNEISIDGKTHDWFGDDTAKRFESYHWQVIKVDGHDPVAIKEAIAQAQSNTSQPTLICCKTTIGKGSPNLAGSHKTHGAPLGEAEIKAMRNQLNWNHPPFVIPADCLQAWNQSDRGNQLESAWNQQWEAYQQAYPAQALELTRRLNGELPKNCTAIFEQLIQHSDQEKKSVATRKASQITLEAIGNHFPEFLGGSADLTGSNLTNFSTSQSIAQHDHGNYIHYGVREFGMFAIMNGIALHGGFIPYGGTFLTFADYGKNAIRLSALMKQKVIYVFTHDSIGLGEDGPTHQPIEQAAMLRMMPNVATWRPCDTVETAIAWQQALSYQSPSCLLLSRQSTVQQTRNETMLNNIAKGGYILRPHQSPDIVLIATGSEVELAMMAAEELSAQNIQAQVVSMPCTEYFDQQSQAYKNQVLPPHVKRIAIEAAHADFWYKYVGLDGHIIGLEQYGLSAPAGDIYQQVGITVNSVIGKVIP